MERDGLGVFEVLVLVLAGVAVLVIGVVWLGATLSLMLAGRPQVVAFSAAADALGRLPGSAGAPANAWAVPYSEVLPGAPLYWLSTGVAAAGATAAAAAGVRWFGRSKVGTLRRRPLGVDARPRFANRRDLRPLLVDDPVPGRFVVAKFGRSLVATEAPPTQGESPTRRLREVRRGDRGAVALIGPSRSGKTTAAVAGILEWNGPAVLSSVKADLLGATHGWRSEVGGVRIYDPMSSSIRRGTSALWSPLQQARTVAGAQRAARALCDAAPRGGVEGGMDFWLAQAEILLSALFFTASNGNGDMDSVCRWVFSQDRPTDAGKGEVYNILTTLKTSKNEAMATAADEVHKSLKSVWQMEDRTRSSIYATAQTVVWPWSDPGVARSARNPDKPAKRGPGKPQGPKPERIDLAWLMNDADGRFNTVYLCSPIEDQRRLAPAFGGLLNDLINQAYRRVAQTGKPLDPPLLIVIDEAGNTPLRSLPEYASTLAGIGVLLVTIWQSIAQLNASYGPQADTILTNHLTKLMYAGLSDPASLSYVDRILGQAEVDTRSRTATERISGGSDQFSTTQVPLAPAHVLRQMRPGDALLVHGTLPPAHVRTRPFYATPHLAERAALQPKSKPKQPRQEVA